MSAAAKSTDMHEEKQSRYGSVRDNDNADEVQEWQDLQSHVDRQNPLSPLQFLQNAAPSLIPDSISGGDM
jgi:hypothetical protein